MNKTNLLQRVGLAVFGIPAVYFCLKLGGLLLLIAVDLIIVLCLIEYLNLIRKQGFRPNTAVTIAGGVMISWDIHFSGGMYGPLILMGISIAATLGGLFRQEKRTLIPDSALALFGSFFFGFSISCLILLRHLPSGFHYTLLAFILIWICDTTAYFAGTSFGRHRLWPQVSPKKTIEGTVAGLIGSCLAALAVRQFLIPQLSVIDCLILGGIAGILGQAGDLVESAFKRSVDVKDSSRFLPGHGGFLDRFDSFFFTVPALYCYIRIVLNT